MYNVLEPVWRLIGFTLKSVTVELRGQLKQEFVGLHQPLTFSIKYMIFEFCLHVQVLVYVGELAPAPASTEPSSTPQPPSTLRIMCRCSNTGVCVGLGNLWKIWNSCTGRKKIGGVT